MTATPDTVAEALQSDYYACRCEADTEQRQGVRCNLHACMDLQEAWHHVWAAETARSAP